MEMKTAIAKAIKSTFSKIGYDLRKRDPSRCVDLHLQSLLSHLNTDCILDVGANEGQFATYARNFGYKGKIVSFEPLPAAHSKLSHNSRNDLEWIAYTRCAIGNQCGETVINISKNSTSSSLLPINDTHIVAAPESRVISEARTRVITLDEASQDLTATSIFLKIDTQGYESQVLEGAKRTLERTRAIQLELSLVELYQGQKLLIDMLKQIEALGFTPWSFFPAFSQRKTGQMLQIDGTFVSKPLDAFR